MAVPRLRRVFRTLVVFFQKIMGWPKGRPQPIRQRVLSHFFLAPMMQIGAACHIGQSADRGRLRFGGGVVYNDSTKKRRPIKRTTERNGVL